MPVGRTPDGLPIGVQVIGRRYREMEVLAVAKELEQALGGWIKPELGGRGKPRHVSALLNRELHHVLEPDDQAVDARRPCAPRAARPA